MARARVSQHVVEVLVPFSVAAVYAPTLVANTSDYGTYGDSCNSDPPDAAWSLRNIATMTGNGTKYTVTMDAVGDAVLRAFTDPAADFSMVLHITGLTSLQPIIGVCALDANGTGRAFCGRDNVYSLFSVSTYAFSNWGARTASGPTVGDHWTEMRRVGSSWSGRYSNDATTWSAWTTGDTDSRTITQVGIICNYNDTLPQTVGMEALFYWSPSVNLSVVDPATAIVSQHVVEVLGSFPGSVQVSQYVVEVLLTEGETQSDPPSAGGTPQTHAFGYAG